MRSTGRVVAADQCGVPLEKRFAFYDQVHTTGMDIKHVVNARAAMTLGKDMVFRDYVQGAFRMRGIGKGQRITVFLIPEVRELMNNELSGCTYTKERNKHVDHTLQDIVAWLVVNSMRSEHLQWSMLCIQSIANIYRKNAYKTFTEYSKRERENGGKTEAAIKLFDQAIDFSLSVNVPDPYVFKNIFQIIFVS